MRACLSRGYELTRSCGASQKQPLLNKKVTPTMQTDAMSARLLLFALAELMIAIFGCKARV